MGGCVCLSTRLTFSVWGFHVLFPACTCIMCTLEEIMKAGVSLTRALRKALIADSNLHLCVQHVWMACPSVFVMLV